MFTFQPYYSLSDQGPYMPSWNLFTDLEPLKSHPFERQLAECRKVVIVAMYGLTQTAVLGPVRALEHQVSGVANRLRKIYPMTMATTNLMTKRLHMVRIRALR
jgi:hypothetical protein